MYIHIKQNLCENELWFGSSSSFVQPLNLNHHRRICMYSSNGRFPISVSHHLSGGVAALSDCGDNDPSAVCVL